MSESSVQERKENASGERGAENHYFFDRICVGNSPALFFSKYVAGMKRKACNEKYDTYITLIKVKWFTHASRRRCRRIPNVLRRSRRADHFPRTIASRASGYPWRMRREGRPPGCTFEERAEETIAQEMRRRTREAAKNRKEFKGGDIHLDDSGGRLEKTLHGRWFNCSACFVHVLGCSITSNLERLLTSSTSGDARVL